MKRPAFQFYPGDWRRDMALQSCSIAARGLWVEMLGLMHDAEPYGHLTVQGKPITESTLARMVGLTDREIRSLITELEEAGVFSRDESGAIYSRRMVRQAHRSKIAKQNGSRGGNPNLINLDNPQVNQSERVGVKPSVADADIAFDLDSSSGEKNQKSKSTRVIDESVLSYDQERAVKICEDASLDPAPMLELTSELAQVLDPPPSHQEIAVRIRDHGLPRIRDVMAARFSSISGKGLKYLDKVLADPTAGTKGPTNANRNGSGTNGSGARGQIAPGSPGYFTARAEAASTGRTLTDEAAERTKRQVEEMRRRKLAAG